MVDAMPERLGWRRGAAIGVVMGITSSVLSLTLSTLGIDLPYAFGLIAVVVAAGMEGATAAVVVTCISMLSVLFFNSSHPLVTTVNTVVIGSFCLVLAYFGGRMKRMKDSAAEESRRLSRRESLLQSIFNSTPAAMLVTDAEGMILAVNASASEVLGCDVSDHDCLRVGDVFGIDRDSDPALMHGQLRVDREGSKATIDVSSVRVPFDQGELRILYVRDLTDSLAAADQLAELHSEVQQLSRASALGQLGSAIAHEINQPIANAVNYAEVARMSLSRGLPRERTEQALESMIAQSMRAAAVLKGLRDFVRRGSRERTWVDAADVLNSSVSLARLPMRQSGADLVIDASTDVGQVLVDSVQIQQVILNLVVNACDAVAGSDVRRIVLSARQVHDQEIEMTVSDTGPGLPEVMRDGLFEPFHTTKTDGLGVGLSICRTIVQNHGGVLRHHDLEGGGTAFGFTLPSRPSQEQ